MGIFSGIGKAIGGVGSALGGIFGGPMGAALGGSLGGPSGGQDQGQMAPAESASAGVQSSMNQMAPPVAQYNPAGGSTYKDAVKEGITSTLARGVGSIVSGPFDARAAREGGANNRAYLDEAFPELNPWEKAGVSAVQPGIQNAGQSNEAAMQSRLLKNQRDLQDKQLELEKLRIASQVYMNDKSTGAQVQAANIGASPMLQQVPDLNQLRRYQLDQVHAETGLAQARTSLTHGQNNRANLESDRTIAYSLMRGKTPDKLDDVTGLNPAQAAAAAVTAGLAGGVGSIVKGKLGGRRGSAGSVPQSMPKPQKLERQRTSGQVLIE